MTPRTFVATGSFIAGLMLCSVEAQADITTYDISGGNQWRTTVDQSLGQQWGIGNFAWTDGVAATAGYGNSATTSLNSNRMMWNCGSDGSLCPGGGSGGAGPTEVFFGYSFFINQGATFRGEAAIIADDFFDLVINGQEIWADTLDGNQDGSGQPVPLTFDLTPYLREGNNVIAMRAMDGYLEGASACAARGTEWQAVTGNFRGNPAEFCKGNRGNEYMFISGSVTVVPEPSGLALVGVALVGVGLTRRRLPSANG